MSGDDDFEPRLGRQRARGGKRGRRYLQRVLAATNLARGGRPGFSKARRGYSGSRTGRGAGVGRLLGSRAGSSALTRRRVIVKTRIVRLAGKGANAAAAHLRYLERDGTTREGDRGALYGRDADAVDAKSFHARGHGDRHQFRFIVSPEDGADYDDLKPLVRRLMARAESDLGTRLDWVAVDHFNTGHPHSHILLRGVDDKGADLVIARDYLTRGFRERAAELIDLDLGPRTDRDIARALAVEIDQDRLTAIDRQLIAEAGEDRLVEARARGAFAQSLRAGRLAKLKKLGLAEEAGRGRWWLAPDLAATLTRIGERDDIIRTMQRAFTAARIERASADRSIYDPAQPDARALTGSVLMRGLADEFADRHYLIVDALDGRSHYVAIGKESAEDIGPGAIVQIEPLTGGAREVDHTIAAVAAANGGRYDVEAHLAFDQRASEPFALTHVRRLEAMRKAGVDVVREASGTWRIGADHLDTVDRFETARLRDRPVAITMLSPMAVDRLVDREAATWLDHRLVDAAPPPARDTGFGHAVRDAENRRRQWLVAQGLGSGNGTDFVARTGFIEALRRRELLTVATRLSSELKRSFEEAASGERIEGLYRRRLDLVSGRFALIERAHDFTLVPWRPVLDRHVGKSVSGLMRGDGINWTIGRGRSGPAR
ncbi:relaxase/mobilization nuclease RlxS [Stakelama saccharophila]|uniref:Relaxase/mobilization nuclease RlxS n=1 Tax=Stakelama saccharophila TaxID=3075605 RepID=A0ABZ0B7W2_9SPHN|nr:relaxase/mobilization nuclease RlxS [Stakelama sp. W311]WNO53473.1 relaxase/mobilization nuclease RlxS [Stakelama sp. W311]